MTDSNAVNILAPPVFWAQRKSLIYVFINVMDCVNPVVKVEKDKLYFRTKEANSSTEYEIAIDFLKEIDPEQSKHSIKGRGAEFVLIKTEEQYWSRLLKDSKKQHWLKIDFNKWRDEEDSDPDNDPADFENMMKKMGGLQSSGRDLTDLDSEDEFEDDEEEAEDVKTEEKDDVKTEEKDVKTKGKDDDVKTEETADVKTEEKAESATSS